MFGRIDHGGEYDDSLYIGRVGVWDRSQDPVVVDWRAPAAEPFYRATGADPLGLVRRRHFATRGRALLDIDDELFGDLSHLDDGDAPRIQGHGALMTALETARSGRLGDIVATIQGEQDEIIRSRLGGILVVQGGPGTGKTVVALHRAAYLLYSYRFPLQDQGVLVIGPNRLFLAYIEQVLPSLGEAGVRLAILSDLVTPSVRSDRLGSEDAAFVKGDLRMVEFIRRAVRQRERPLRKDLVIGFGLQNLRLSAFESGEIISQAQRRFRTHNAARRFVEREVFATLANSGREEVDPGVLRDRIRWNYEIREALEWMWPVLTPAQLLYDVLGSPALLAKAGRGLFSPVELAAISQRRDPHVDSFVWTFDDAPILDEVRAHLGARPGRKDTDEVRTYGHIVIDEAQDLSPMALRMVSRRSLNGSMTVVGDLAQSTGAWPAESWDDVVAQLPANHKHEPQRRELTTGYRIPAPAMDLAARVLTAAAPGLVPPVAIRHEGSAPVISRVDDLGSALPAAIEREIAEIGSGNVAVVVPRSLVDPLSKALRGAGMDFGTASRSGLDRQVALVPVQLVKGLEVDAVLVVEPARILSEEAQGMRALYVALTRATKRVGIIHTDPLPDVLLNR